jgi:2-polyprenyl-3-methyl-5-hydroxy-6-metoxy-1,4-benzoquinol methylase
MTTSTDRVKDYFNDHASRFSSIYDEEQKNPVTRFFDRIWRKSMFLRFERVVEIVRESGSKQVLDVGCGPGWHDVHIAKSQDVHVTGVDLAPNMIRIARRQALEHGVSARCKFSIGNVLDYEFSDTYDVVFALGVMEYCENPDQIIRIMHRLADKKVVISLPVEKHLLTPKRRLQYKLRRCPLWFYDEAKIGALMRRSGVEKFDIEKNSRDYLVVIRK